MAPKPQARLERETRTLRVMIELFCHDNHHPAGTLCADCHQLLLYATQRIDRCPYQDDKPTCARCPIHCYVPARREQVRRVMRYAGPRMMLSHPVLTLLHYLDEMTQPDTSEAGEKGKR
jgi:hypothetical protein